MAGAGWQTTVGPGGKAHYIREDGTSACSDRIGPWGVRMGLLFSRGWRPSIDRDHRCGFCQKEHPFECRCGGPKCLRQERRATAGEEALRPEASGERRESNDRCSAQGRALHEPSAVEAERERDRIADLVLPSVGPIVRPDVADLPLDRVLHHFERDLRPDGQGSRDPRQLGHRAYRGVHEREAVQEEMVRVVRHDVSLAERERVSGSAHQPISPDEEKRQT